MEDTDRYKIEKWTRNLKKYTFHYDKRKEPPNKATQARWAAGLAIQEANFVRGKTKDSF